MNIEGTRALGIGGSSGMGRGAARALMARGVAVTITSRTDEGVDKAVAGLSDVTAEPGVARRGRVEGVRCDLRELDSIAVAVKGLGRIDHLVISAAPARGSTNQDFFDGKFWGTKTAPAEVGITLPR